MLFRVARRQVFRCCCSVSAILLPLISLLVGFDLSATAQTNSRPANNLQQEDMRRRQLSSGELQSYQQQAWQSQVAEQRAEQQSTPQLPPGFPLPEDEQQYVEQLLDYWQQVSDQVKQYRCDFRRLDYDTTVCNVRDRQTNNLYAAGIADGVIRFSAPGKARFETTSMRGFAGPPQTNGGDAQYTPVEGHSIWGRSIHECWVCTGDAVYNLDFKQKQNHVTKIPPQLRGNVVQSPLPFLFGAKKDEIMTRYWVRYIPKYRTAADGQRTLIEDEYWLDVYPKRIQDSRIFSKIELILSAADFMPKAIHMYSANYNPKKNNLTSQYFAFENRKVNGRWESIKDSLGMFVKPALPPTWRTVTELPKSAATAREQR